LKKSVFISLFLTGALALGTPAGFAQKKDGQKEKSKAVAAAPATAHGNADAITAAELKDFLTFIASDEMEGRDTPSRGLDTAAKFIAFNLSRWGLRPAGDDGTYFQRITLKRGGVEPVQTKAEINGASFPFGEGFIAGRNPGTASGTLVYAGHGWAIKSKGINAYQGPNGVIDVKDRIVVIHSGALPKGMNFNDLRKLSADDRLDPATYALQHGARGLILIPNPAMLNTWEQRRENALQPGGWQMAGSVATPMPVITASAAMVKALFDGEKLDGEAILKAAASAEYPDAFELGAAKNASFTVAINTETAPTQNVVAVFDGSDPVLKNEYVAIGAHYDHVGMKKVGTGDRIFNGADDDGSGTTGVLAIAEAFAKGPRPKRSILFVWHCGEEKGLWGSDYFTDHPTVPLNQVITQLNIDMIGRSKTEANKDKQANRNLSGPNEIYVIGSKMMSTELGNLSEAVNRSYLNLEFNYKYDAPNDPERFFYRSDHYNYARKGVPIIFYFDGVHEDYHQVSDEVSKIDFQKMEKVTRTIYATAWELANAAKRPAVDKHLSDALSGN